MYKGMFELNYHLNFYHAVQWSLYQQHRFQAGWLVLQQSGQLVGRRCVVFVQLFFVFLWLFAGCFECQQSALGDCICLFDCLFVCFFLFNCFFCFRLIVCWLFWIALKRTLDGQWCALGDCISKRFNFLPSNPSAATTLVIATDDEDEQKPDLKILKNSAEQSTFTQVLLLQHCQLLWMRRRMVMVKMNLNLPFKMSKRL